MGVYAQAQAGDPDALAALVRRHIPLVQALARRFSFCEDAFQQGCMGLVGAIRRFREDAGCQFSTYAVPLILGEMRRSFSHTLGWRARAALKKAREYQENILQSDGKLPSVQEIAAHTGLPAEELMLLWEHEKGPVYDETGLLFASMPDPLGESWLIRLCIRDILDRMPRDESWLLRNRFLMGRSQTEIARSLGRPQYSISRWEKRARQRFIRAWNE